MPTIDTLLRRSIAPADGEGAPVTLDRAFQGLPGTAHGGSVLALVDALAEIPGAREVAGLYRQRVPLGIPLRLTRSRSDSTFAFRLCSHAGALLVDGHVTAVADGETHGQTAGRPLDDASTHPLPVSSACFACGVDNALGLQARLAFDGDAVRGTWRPREPFRTPDGALAPAALTTLLDEAAFWLGALATGESGMTTDIRVTLHRAVPFGGAIAVEGARAAVRQRDDDPRYWETSVAARADDDRIVATGRITFVAVRGAAKRLVTGMLAMNPPEIVRRVFPGYAR